MTSRQDEQRCRCAYNTSLDTAREATTADDRKTAACVPPPPPPSTTTVTCGTTAPAAQQVVGRAVVDPCGRSPRPRGAGCGEKPHPADRTDGCGKPKSRCDDDEGRCENARPCGGCPSERDGCGGPWTCDANVCVRLDDGCGGFDLTPYGQQFAICTDRVVSGVLVSRFRLFRSRRVTT